MASDWQPSKLGDDIAVNLSQPLAKGSDSVYISMQQVDHQFQEPFVRTLQPIPLPAHQEFPEQHKSTVK